MSSSSSSDAVQTQQAAMRALIAQNLYDTKIVSQLEENVKFQIKSGSYDAESNRELLKLYAVSPDMIKLEILTRVLLKALMEMPAPDFHTSLFLLNEKLQLLEPIKLLIKLSNLLDTCAFKRFWKDLDAFRANAANQAVVNFAEVKEFDSAIRRFINITISSTYSSISTVALKELWNLSDKKSFEEAVLANGWTLAEEGKTVVLRATPTKEAGAVATAASVQRAEQPSIEQLAKLITAA